MPDAPDPQLVLTMDAAVCVAVVEQRGGGERELRVGPLGEADARVLAALLLMRATVPPHDDGPWLAAVAGGRRTVRLER